MSIRWTILALSIVLLAFTIPTGAEPTPQAKAKASNIKKAMASGLAWLSQHQSENGAFEADRFHLHCGHRPVPATAQADGLGKAIFTPGITALVCHAFLQAGYRPGGPSYGKLLEDALRHLVSLQQESGALADMKDDEHDTLRSYAQTLTALALVEAHGTTVGKTTKSEWKTPAQRAFRYLLKQETRYTNREQQVGGWRYDDDIEGDIDTHMTAWVVEVLLAADDVNGAATRAGRKEPFAFDEAVFERVNMWVDRMTDKDYGRIGYISRGSGPARPMALLDAFPGEKSEAMTAAGMWIRLVLGDDPKDKVMRLGEKLMVHAALRPKWDDQGSIDMIYWYHGARALSMMPSAESRYWRDDLLNVALRNQCRTGDVCKHKGSWHPDGVWGRDGAGRLYSTAIMILTLQALSGNA